MTTQDFLSKIEDHRKADNRIGIPAMVWMVVGCILGIAIAPNADAHPWLILFLPVFFGGLIVFLIFMLRAARHNAEKLGLVCPSCNHNLVPSKSLVIASKHCGHCGNRILSDD